VSKAAALAAAVTVAAIVSDTEALLRCVMYVHWCCMQAAAVAAITAAVTAAAAAALITASSSCSSSNSSSDDSSSYSSECDSPYLTRLISIRLSAISSPHIVRRRSGASYSSSSPCAYTQASHNSTTAAFAHKSHRTLCARSTYEPLQNQHCNAALCYLQHAPSTCAVITSSRAFEALLCTYYIQAVVYSCTSSECTCRRVTLLRALELNMRTTLRTAESTSRCASSGAADALESLKV
jgi:hypothetical protein